MDLEQLWRRARGAIRGVSQHLENAHKDFVNRWPHEVDLVEDANRALQALNWKLLAISFHIDALWGLAEMKDSAIMMLHSSKVASAEWAEMEHDIGLITLESVLFQFSAFIDLHMRYSLLLLGQKPQGKMKWKNYKRALGHLKSKSISAEKLLNYYEESVWADGQWGFLLRELRDKIAHRDRLYPSRTGYDGDTEIAVTWLSIAGSPLERLAEDLSNGVISLLQDTTPIIMSREWPS